MSDINMIWSVLLPMLVVVGIQSIVLAGLYSRVPGDIKKIMAEVFSLNSRGNKLFGHDTLREQGKGHKTQLEALRNTVDQFLPLLESLYKSDIDLVVKTDHEGYRFSELIMGEEGPLILLSWVESTHWRITPELKLNTILGRAAELKDLKKKLCKSTCTKKVAKKTTKKAK